MRVETYLFGEIEVNPDQVITFPDGMAGFEGNKRYLLVHEENNTATASFTLQSLDDPALAFQIIDPAAIGFNYELALTDAEDAILQSPKGENLAVMLILFKRIEANDKEIGANFRAPIILNTQARVGLQKIIQNPRSNITISNLVSEI